MSVNRVQKLLFSEYCDFEDMVLIESPFAQTTRDGKGIRQVHLGLTPSKLVLATDVLPPVDFGNFRYIPGTDPEIETFELIAIYPVECVNLSIYRRRKRQAIKARFCNNKVAYFELGGFEKRGMFWNLWCEKVKFLCPGDSGSSRSETSVATSTTGSTLYLLDRRLVAANGIKQLWCKFGPNAVYGTNLVNDAIGNSQASLTSRWTDRHLYLGKNFIDMALEYRPNMHHPTANEFVQTRKSSKRYVMSSGESKIIPYFQENNLSIGDSIQVNRFSSGVKEGCNTGLFLTAEEYIIPRRLSEKFEDISPSLSFAPGPAVNTGFEQLAESGVLLWEFYNASDPNKYRIRHRRRYGFCPQPIFLYGFGPWSVSPGSKYSLQLKRAVSDIHIQRPLLESEMRLSVPKRQLVATVSCQNLYSRRSMKCHSILNAPRKPVTYFWTCDYWYRPKSARTIYEELRTHLRKINDYHNNQSKRTKKGKRKFLRKFYSVPKELQKDTDEDSNDEPYLKKRRKRKSSFIYNIFSRVDEMAALAPDKQPNETYLQYMKRILRVDVSWSAWDFDSNILAEQITMIDKELFLKISSEELKVLMWQKSTKGAPNISAMIAFSQRTSCLFVSEILKDSTERSRARLLARVINVADKCHRMSNFNSCRTVLCSLQNPAIYRLRKTWAYVRKKHASKYLIFEFLCRLYRDPRMPIYQKTFFLMSQNTPFLPYIGDIIARLLNKVPDFKIKGGSKSISRQTSFNTKSSASKSIEIIHQITNTPNLFSKLLHVFTGTEPVIKTTHLRVRKVKKRIPHQQDMKFKGLYEYFKPLYYHEDRRVECLAEAIDFLEKCQLGAINYNFDINEISRSFLLKARYKEDKENFYTSVRIEGPSNLSKMYKIKDV